MPRTRELTADLESHGKFKEIILNAIPHVRDLDEACAYLKAETENRNYDREMDAACGPHPLVTEYGTKKRLGIKHMAAMEDNRDQINKCRVRYWDLKFDLTTYKIQKHYGTTKLCQVTKEANRMKNFEHIVSYFPSVVTPTYWSADIYRKMIAKLVALLERYDTVIHPDIIDDRAAFMFTLIGFLNQCVRYTVLGVKARKEAAYIIAGKTPKQEVIHKYQSLWASWQSLAERIPIIIEDNIWALERVQVRDDFNNHLKSFHKRQANCPDTCTQVFALQGEDMHVETTHATNRYPYLK